VQQNWRVLAFIPGWLSGLCLAAVVCGFGVFIECAENPALKGGVKSAIGGG
jgi:hypothetical protein